MKLGIPEILLEIFSYLKDDKPSLYAIIQVKRAWFQYGIGFLWDLCHSPMNTLAKVPARRRQIYAYHIRTLKIRADNRYLDISIPGMPHMNVQKLTLHGYCRELTGLGQLRKYMRGSLQKLELDDCLIDLPLVKHLVKACPQLAKLKIQYCAMKPPLSALTMLKYLHTVKAIELRTWESASPSHFIGLLVGSGPVGGNTRATIPAIRSLSFSAVREPVPNILQTFHHLQDLYLTITKPASNVLGQVIGSLTQLRVLDLTLPFGTVIPREDLLSLSSLYRLEELRIAPVPRGSRPFTDRPAILAHDFKTADFIWLVTKLPGIRRFELNVKWDVCASVLNALGRHFPRLSSLELDVTLNLNLIDATFPRSEGPRFPHLKSLVLIHRNRPWRFEEFVSR